MKAGEGRGGAVVCAIEGDGAVKYVVGEGVVG